MTGEIDFSYIPSEWDVVEKRPQVETWPRWQPQGRRRKDKKISKGSIARKMISGKVLPLNQKERREETILQEVARKNKHGKGEGSRIK